MGWRGLSYIVHILITDMTSGLLSYGIFLGVLLIKLLELSRVTRVKSRRRQLT